MPNIAIFKKKKSVKFLYKAQDFTALWKNHNMNIITLVFKI